jgi:hypothetical protein
MGREEARIEKNRRLVEASEEVKRFEQGLAALQGLHHQCSPPIDWLHAAPIINPHEPIVNWSNTLGVELKSILNEMDAGDQEKVSAQALDEQLRALRLEKHRAFLQQTIQMRLLASNVLNGNLESYRTVLTSYNPFAPVQKFGVEISITPYDRSCIGIALLFPGKEAMPSEDKSLSTSGKLRVKAMSRVRTQEIYQNHISSCILRVGLEAFAWLPVKTVIVTALVNQIASSTGLNEKVSFFSTAIKREILEKLNMQTLSPAEAMQNFICCGGFEVSRKTGKYEAVTPIQFSDFVQKPLTPGGVGDLLARIKTLRTDIKSLIKTSEPQAPLIDEIEPT